VAIKPKTKLPVVTENLVVKEVVNIKPVMLQGIPSELGWLVRDVVTGIQGIAYSLYEHFNNTKQISVYGRTDKKGNLPTIWAFDACQLVKMGDGITELRKPPPYVSIQLGIKVKDLFTGYTGITYQKVTHLNGCVGYLVIPEKNNKATVGDGFSSGQVIEYQRLEVVDSKILAKIRKNLGHVFADTAIPQPEKVKQQASSGGCAPTKILR
jgi:hypothetical protein